MNINFLQEFWFGERRFTDLEVHRDFLTVQIPEVNIDAQIWLTIFSPGIDLGAGVTGLAAAGVKSVRFIDPKGVPQFQEFNDWRGYVWVDRCTEITFAFHVQLAWAKAEGMIYWHN